MQEKRDLEVWKHFAAMGGTDKNTMIVAVSWLLGLTAGAIGYRLTQPGSLSAAGPVHPVSSVMVSLLGLVLSGLATYVVLLYAGYANRNWAQADMIARKRAWRDLLPKGGAGETTPRQGLAWVAWRWAREFDPERKLAPVFRVYALLAIVSSLANLFLLVWSLIAPATPGRTGC